MCVYLFTISEIGVAAIESGDFNSDQTVPEFTDIHMCEIAGCCLSRIMNRKKIYRPTNDIFIIPKLLLSKHFYIPLRASLKDLTRVSISKAGKNTRRLGDVQFTADEVFRW